MSEWISVRDRLPEPSANGTGYSDDVLFVIADEFCGDEGIEVELRTGWYDWMDEVWVRHERPFDCGEVIDNTLAVTHWMPLPAAPEGITYDDCTELCEWYKNGAKKADDPGVFLDPLGTIRMSCCIDDGIPIDEIVSKLPPEVGKAFKEIMDSLIEHPDKMERCAEYADALDGFDDAMSEHDFGEFTPLFSGCSWREDWHNCVVIRGYPEEVTKLLHKIGFRWERENGDCGGFIVFGSHSHIVLKNNDWIDAFAFSNFLQVTDDGRILRFSTDDINL